MRTPEFYLETLLRTPYRRHAMNLSLTSLEAADGLLTSREFFRTAGALEEYELMPTFTLIRAIEIFRKIPESERERIFAEAQRTTAVNFDYKAHQGPQARDIMTACGAA